MLVQVAASLDTWIWKAVAYAVSHCRTTWLTVAVAPRSTCSHCGSLAALDQRVPVLPSTAEEAGVPTFSVDDAVAGLFWESRVVAALADSVDATIAYPASRASTPVASAMNRARRWRSRPGRGTGSMGLLPGWDLECDGRELPLRDPAAAEDLPESALRDRE